MVDAQRLVFAEGAASTRQLISRARWREVVNNGHRAATPAPRARWCASAFIATRQFDVMTTGRDADRRSAGR